VDISIIIPHYNLEPAMLQRAIASAADQFLETRFEWEIIVVDDGSDTPPVAVVQEFHRANIRLYCRPHARQGAARNYGLQQAQGEYILFLDADDYLLPHSLPPVLACAIDKDLDILRFKTIKVYDSHCVKTQTASLACSRPMTGERYMLHHNLQDAPYAYIFRRDLAQSHDVLFPENIFLEDCIFTAQLHHFASSLCVIESTVYAYYQRPESTVNTTDKEHKAMLRQHHLMVIDHLSAFIDVEARSSDTDGLRRKLRFLVIDYLRRLCNNLTYKEITSNQLPLLRDRGLYPLPVCREYGLKYLTYACLANNKLGLRVLKLASRFGIV
jgi:glycosyltransferase involved in cell wall biosynthesis